MPNNAASLLANLTRSQGGTGGVRMFRATVSANREDGRVNLQVGISLVTGVLCLDSYEDRWIGDTVQVMDINGVWLVIGRYGEDPYGADGRGATPVASRQYLADGYTQVNAANNEDFHRIGASGQGGDQFPYVLAWSFYDGTTNYLVSEMAPASTTACVVAMARSGIPHGKPEPVSIALRPHGHDALPSTLVPVTGLSSVQFGLEWGEIIEVRLPDDWVAAIKSGTVRGMFAESVIPTTIGDAGYCLMSDVSGNYYSA